MTNMDPEKWLVFCVITGRLVAVVRVQVEFQMADHLVCLQEGKTAVRKRSVLQAEEALAETIAGGAVQGAR